MLAQVGKGANTLHAVTSTSGVIVLTFYNILMNHSHLGLSGRKKRHQLKSMLT